MIPEEIASAVMEFAQRCREIPSLRLAVLFGSAVSGGLSKKSDIDILLVFDKSGNVETGPDAETIHRMAGEVSSRWDLPYPFSFVMYGKDEAIEPSLLRDVLKDGFIIYARTDAVLDGHKERLRPYMLITYTLKGLTPKNKMALQRGLFGYRTERKYGKKKYLNSSTGLVGNNGRRIGPTAFLLSYAEVEKVRGLFKRCGCRFKEIPIWLENADTK
jgi:predicted nucleotidyltransferase